MLVSCLPANAATILTFEVAGTTDFSTDTISSFSVGAGGTLQFTKELDATSPNILQAVVLGTHFASAALIAYQELVSPEAELFR